MNPSPSSSKVTSSAEPSLTSAWTRSPCYTPPWRLEVRALKSTCPGSNLSLTVYYLWKEPWIKVLTFLCLHFFNTAAMRISCVRACVLSCFSCVWLCATPWTVAHQAPLSMGFSRQGHWSGLPCPPPGDLSGPEMEPASPETAALQADSLLLSHQGSPEDRLHHQIRNTSSSSLKRGMVTRGHFIRLEKSDELMGLGVLSVSGCGLLSVLWLLWSLHCLKFSIC